VPNFQSPDENEVYTNIARRDENGYSPRELPAKYWEKPADTGRGLLLHRVIQVGKMHGAWVVDKDTTVS
jgi:hypothetical protein